MTATRAQCPLPTIVAVSADGSDGALRFGALEVVREGGRLHVLHVVGLDPVPATRSAQICFQAVERARELAGPQVSVTSEIFHGELVDGIVDLSRDARVVVLERRDVDVPRTDPWATSAKVAARSPVPVVCVPRGWNFQGVGTVTVGVSDTLSCVPLLREALSTAAARRARLRILHVEPLSGRSDCEDEIATALVEAMPGLEGVTTSIEIVLGDNPVQPLRKAMETSELLVIGRHHPVVPRGSRLGPVARKVIRRASCPVLLLTPGASTSSADWVFSGRLA